MRQLAERSLLGPRCRHQLSGQTPPLRDWVVFLMSLNTWETSGRGGGHSRQRWRGDVCGGVAPWGGDLGDFRARFEGDFWAFLQAVSGLSGLSGFKSPRRGDQLWRFRGRKVKVRQKKRQRLEPAFVRVAGPAAKQRLPGGVSWEKKRELPTTNTTKKQKNLIKITHGVLVLCQSNSVGF